MVLGNHHRFLQSIGETCHILVIARHSGVMKDRTEEDINSEKTCIGFSKQPVANTLLDKRHTAQGISYNVLPTRNIFDIKIVTRQLGHPALLKTVQLRLCQDHSTYAVQGCISREHEGTGEVRMSQDDTVDSEAFRF
ncbi:unnamed protein product [Merluccius merluccius]